jgi:dihydrofolate reductase
MPKLTVFNNVSLDGYFVDAKGDMSWAHGRQDEEWKAFIAGNASGGGALLFGRVTYQMMAAFWPTPQAMESLPEVARRMNSAAKVVFSRTLSEAPWSNTRLVKGDLAQEVRRMKGEEGPDLVILGSGSIVSQLAGAGLVDEFQVVVVPVALGGGRTMFEGIGRTALRRTSARVFGNGNVVLCYAQAK